MFPVRSLFATMFAAGLALAAAPGGLAPAQAPPRAKAPAVPTAPDVPDAPEFQEKQPEPAVAPKPPLPPKIAPPGASGFGSMSGPGVFAYSTTNRPNWEYEFADAPQALPAFQKLLAEKGKAGWEYAGTVTGLKPPVDADDPKASMAIVAIFKRPAGGRGVATTLTAPRIEFHGQRTDLGFAAPKVEVELNDTMRKLGEEASKQIAAAKKQAADAMRDAGARSAQAQDMMRKVEGLAERTGRGDRLPALTPIQPTPALPAPKPASRGTDAGPPITISLNAMPATEAKSVVEAYLGDRLATRGGSATVVAVESTNNVFVFAAERDLALVSKVKEFVERLDARALDTQKLNRKKDEEAKEMERRKPEPRRP